MPTILVQDRWLKALSNLLTLGQGRKLSVPSIPPNQAQGSDTRLRDILWR